MNKCSNCNHNLKPDKNFCTNCGTQMSLPWYRLSSVFKATLWGIFWGNSVTLLIVSFVLFRKEYLVEGYWLLFISFALSFTTLFLTPKAKNNTKIKKKISIWYKLLILTLIWIFVTIFFIALPLIGFVLTLEKDGIFKAVEEASFRAGSWILVATFVLLPPVLFINSRHGNFFKYLSKETYDRIAAIIRTVIIFIPILLFSIVIAHINNWYKPLPLAGTTWIYDDGEIRRTLSYKTNRLTFEYYIKENSESGKEDGTYTLQGDTLTVKLGSGHERKYIYDGKSFFDSENQTIIYKPRQ